MQHELLSDSLFFKLARDSNDAIPKWYKLSLINYFSRTIINTTLNSACKQQTLTPN